MNKFTYILGVSFVVLCLDGFTKTAIAGGPIVWAGPRTMTFTKADNADWLLESNQDRITSTVWITRGNTQGIFNIAKEAAYQKNISPVGTEWAEGSISNYSTLTYTTGLTIPGSSLAGKELVLHLIDDDIYVSVKFLSFTGGTTGGGFSYERAQADTLTSVQSKNKISLPKAITLNQNYPNPFNPTTTIEFTLAENGNVSLKVYTILGQEVATLVNDGLKAGVLHQISFNASQLSSGIYFYRLNTGKNLLVKKLMLLK